MVIYFTGTGNSRYVARLMAQHLNDSLLDIAPYVQAKEGYTFANNEPLVFVLPVYVAAPPLAFMEFLRKSSFQGCKDAYFVMTCAGAMGGSPEYCRRLCKEKGLTYMGCNDILMPQNYIVYFSMKTPEENSRIVEAAAGPAKALADSVASRKRFSDPNMKKWEFISTQLVLKPYYKGFITAKKFRVEDSCIGCGKCAAVCPLGNIRMENKLPVWEKNCTHCMACINLCPKDAIQYGKNSAGKIRYRGPEQVLKVK